MMQQSSCHKSLHGRRHRVVDPQQQKLCVSVDGVSSRALPNREERGDGKMEEEAEMVGEGGGAAEKKKNSKALQLQVQMKSMGKQLFRSLLGLLPSPPTSSSVCTSWGHYSDMLYAASGRNSNVSKVTGTLYGQRKGHVFLAVQEAAAAASLLQPVLLLLELGTATNSLVKEMASGLVRIALECERRQNRGKLLWEPVWTMYCNGRRTGYAIRRNVSPSDLHLLTLVGAISMGAGVLPMARTAAADAAAEPVEEEEDSEGEEEECEFEEEEEGAGGDVMYMRARFERVVGSRDSEAFYMMNPDATTAAGPELSIFLLRI